MKKKAKSVAKRNRRTSKLERKKSVTESDISQVYTDVIQVEPLPCEPMPNTVPALSYWSFKEGQGRGYC